MTTKTKTKAAIAAPPTQVKRPERAAFRTAFQALIAFSVMAPFIYQAATNHSPETATGAAAVGLGIASGIARVMALPAVEQFLRHFVPWLAASPQPTAGT